MSSKSIENLKKHEITWSPERITVKSIISNIADGSWNLRPEYQRYFVWDQKKQNKFIDSLIRGWPTPLIWIRKIFDENGIEKFEIMDGQQRLTTLKNFYDGQFSYTPEQSQDSNMDLSFSEYMNSKIVSNKSDLESGEKELDSILKHRLDHARLPILEMEYKNSIQVKETFIRLNSSGMGLTQQELWNTIYDGPFKRIIYDLAHWLEDHQFWGKTIWKRPKKDRMSRQSRLGQLLIIVRKPSFYNQNNEVEQSYIDLNNESDVEKCEKYKKITKEIFKVIEYASKGPISSNPFLSSWNAFYSLFHLLIHYKKEEKMKINKSNVKNQLQHHIKDFVESYNIYSDKVSLMKRKQGEDSDEYQNFLEKNRNIYSKFSETLNKEPNKEFTRRERFRLLKNCFIIKDKNDPRRAFTQEQRETIFYNWYKIKSENETFFRECDGLNCEEQFEIDGKWEADHINRHADGGDTDLSNGQALCRKCHSLKTQKENIS